MTKAADVFGPAGDSESRNLLRKAVAFSEDEHPRDGDGKFTSGSSSSSGGDKPKTLSDDDKKAAVKAVAEIRDKLSELAAKNDGAMTGSEAKKFVDLRREMDSIRFDYTQPATAISLGKTTPEERKSTLDDAVYVAASKDALKSRKIFVELGEHVAGAAMNADSPIDKIMNGENPDISPKELYDTFSDTRDALRAQYGDTITLYRSPTKQKDKYVTNWATTKEFVLQFGDKSIEKETPVDDVIAMNVLRSGMYHELIIGKPPKEEKTEKSVSKTADDILDRGVDVARAIFAKYYEGDYMSPGRPVSGSFEHLIQQVRDPLIAGCGCEYRPKLDDTGTAKHDYSDGYDVPHHYPSVAATFATRGIVACHECGKNWEVPYTVDDNDDKTSITTGDPVEVIQAYLTPDGESVAENT